MERPGGADEVERAGRERKLLGVGLDELGVLGRALSRLGEHLRDDVDADDLANERGEREREGPGAGADVERALLAGQGQEPGDLLACLLGPSILLLGDRDGSL